MGDEAIGVVTCVYGPYVKELGVVGRTLEAATEAVRGVLGAPAGASVLLNGRSGRADTLLRAGDTLEFVRRTPEKG